MFKWHKSELFSFAIRSKCDIIKANPWKEEVRPMEVGALIVAAGMSSRMGMLEVLFLQGAEVLLPLPDG